jgi:hypothetical protein
MVIEVAFYKKTMIIIAVVAGVAVLCFFNPENTIWLPKCPFFLLTGYQCPACGSQRAIYHLLHFDIVAAFRYNPFMLISIPYAIALITVTRFDVKDKLLKLYKFCYNSITVYTYVSLFIFWWILRNIIEI